MQQTKTKEQTHITRAALLNRPGWSPARVKTFLGEPDLRKKVYGSKHPLCLYEAKRIESTETTESFLSGIEKLNELKASRKKVAQEKRAKLLKSIEETEIHIEQIPLNMIRRMAVADYNDRQLERGGDFACEHNSDKDFLDRISVNFIRHHLTNYHSNLDWMHGKTGVNMAYFRLKIKIIKKIAELYPDLKYESENQIQRTTQILQTISSFNQ